MGGRQVGRLFGQAVGTGWGIVHLHVVQYLSRIP